MESSGISQVMLWGYAIAQILKIPQLFILAFEFAMIKTLRLQPFIQDLRIGGVTSF